MKKALLAITCLLTVMALIIVSLPMHSEAAIAGIEGTRVGNAVTFNLAAKTGYVTTGDGGSVFIWGYANEDPTPGFCAAGGCVQYSGPTLIVNEGDVVTINFKNNLPVASSIAFPGQIGVTAADKAGAVVGGMPGFLTRDARPNGGEVTYTLTNMQPGTYLYQSGTRPDLQIEMGLVGAIVVRPAGFVPLVTKIPYAGVAAYNYEYLFLLTEADPRVHEHVALGRMNQVDTADFKPTFWFINGRTLPDTLSANYAVNMPVQPYGSLARLKPYETALYRILEGGRDGHPFHTHGNNHNILAKQGRLLGAGGANSISAFTSAMFPGETEEAYMTWSPDVMGWDIYGDATHPVVANECSSLPLGLADSGCPHGKPVPTILPDINDVTPGQFYSGSPYLGSAGVLLPGEGGFNPTAGLFFMQHSHSEKELTNNNTFPGGMATFLIVEHPSVVIPAE